MKALNILIEASGSLTSTAMISAIKAAGHRVCGSDISDFNAAAHLCDDFIIMPRANDAHLWERTQELLIKHHIDVVIPTLDESLLGWSMRRAKLAREGIAVFISPPRTIQTFLDKWKTYRFFRAHNIPTPKTALFTHHGVLKPRFGRGGAGITILSKTQLEQYYTDLTGGGAK